MLTTEDVNRITREVVLGMKPERKDDADEAKFRKKLIAETAEMRERGQIIDLPKE